MDNEQTLLNTREKGLSTIFSGLTYQEMRRRQIQSLDWLGEKLKEVAKGYDIKTTRPEIGRLYLFKYKAKWREVLPYWDAYPLTIILKLHQDPGAMGFAGLNFHYLDLEQRMRLLGLITGFQDLKSQQKDRKFIQTYDKLKQAAEIYVKFSYKRYLFNYMESKFIRIPITQWKEMMYLPISKFHKESKEYVQSLSSKRIWK